MISTTDRTAKIMKYRIADALVCFLILTFTAGFFTALFVSLIILMSARLERFRSVLPDSFYDDYGKPTFVAENLHLMLLGVVSAILMFAGYSFCGIILGIMGVLDLFRNQIDVLDFIYRKITSIISRGRN